MIDADALAAFAETHAASLPAVRALVEEIVAATGATSFYIFWTSSSGGGGAGPTRRTRVLVAFSSPDAALAFAQRNQLVGAERPRVRQLSLLQLFHVVLSTSAIRGLLLAGEADEETPGRLPAGLQLARTEILERLNCRPH